MADDWMLGVGVSIVGGAVMREKQIPFEDDRKKSKCELAS
jgi:hypothetical protein